jgi:hypothetical protein
MFDEFSSWHGVCFGLVGLGYLVIGYLYRVVIANGEKLAHLEGTMERRSNAKGNTP